MKHNLSPIYSFSIEPYKERLRLIVFKNDEEFVCRKENFKNLMTFLSNENAQIFKGGLRLKKAGDTIDVQVKGETVGELKEMDFQNLLANV